MPDNFFSLPKEMQNKIIVAASYKLSLSPIVVEKDLWVCWVLATLFSIKKLTTPIVFKGGTSLSKCYQLIRRFSEDLDITLDYRMLRKLNQPIENYTRAFLKKLTDELKALVKESIYEVVLPEFNYAIKNMKNDVGSLMKTEVSSDGEKVRLYYPSIFDQSTHYLSNSILIEFGGRNVTEPNNIHIVKPYLASYVKNLILPEARVNVLSPLRTFWEKVTLIHVECHRGRLLNNSERLSRHWYDLAMLAKTDIAKKALADEQLMVDVIRNKQAFFNASYANYEKCLARQFQLIPCKEELEPLQRDFESMVDAGMFYGAIPSFSECIDSLNSLEEKLNS